MDNSKRSRNEDSPLAKNAKSRKGSLLFRYPEHKMTSAIQELRDNPLFSVRSASLKYVVPYETLRQKVRGIKPQPRRMGPQPLLTTAIEKRISTCLFNLADAGFPITKEQLLNNVAEYVSANGHQNLFANNLPGRSWFDAFKKRNQISLRIATNINRAQARVSEKDVRGWFAKVKDFCSKHDGLDALNDPSRIYNLDESAFYLSPSPGRVIAKRGSKFVYNLVKNSEKQAITVLFGGTPAGTLAPPMIVFKNKRFPAEIRGILPCTWAIGNYFAIFIYILYINYPHY